MLTDLEKFKWYKRLLIGGILFFVMVLTFWLSGEYENRFALLMGIAAAAFIWQGYKGMKTSKKSG